jgi:hypothetical protein
MPTRTWPLRPPGRPRLCDARYVSVRAGLYPQRTPHKTALTATAGFNVDIMARAPGSRVVRRYRQR